MSTSAAYMRQYLVEHTEHINGQRRAKYRERMANDVEFRANKNRLNREYVARLMSMQPEQLAVKAIRERARKRDFAFDLTPEWYRDRFEDGCAMTGLSLDPYGSKTAFTAHVDRIDPILGYVQSNCRLVCASYNMAKFDWEDSDVLRMARALVSYNRTSNA